MDVPKKIRIPIRTQSLSHQIEELTQKTWTLTQQSAELTQKNTESSYCGLKSSIADLSACRDSQFYPSNSPGNWELDWVLNLN